MSQLILASSSPRRRELIATLGIPFTVMKPDVDESQHPAEPPLAYVKRLSILKADTIAGRTPAAVLAADTIVVLGSDTTGAGEILGKPADATEARHMLRRLRGRAHQVCTAFTLRRGAAQITRVVRTTVHMRYYTDDEIEAYIATGDPFDKAGGYAIQHEGFHPVAHIEGCYENVVGLPLCAVQHALLEIGHPGVIAPADCDCITTE